MPHCRLLSSSLHSCTHGHEGPTWDSAGRGGGHKGAGAAGAGPKRPGQKVEKRKLLLQSGLIRVKRPETDGYAQNQLLTLLPQQGRSERAEGLITPPTHRRDTALYPRSETHFCLPHTPLHALYTHPYTDTLHTRSHTHPTTPLHRPHTYDMPHNPALDTRNTPTTRTFTHTDMDPMYSTYTLYPTPIYTRYIAHHLPLPTRTPHNYPVASFLLQAPPLKSR